MTPSMMPPRSDADRLLAIQELDRIVQAKESELAQARTDCDKARSTCRAQERQLRAIDQQIAAIGRTVQLQGKGVYLNGTALDRGTLRLDAEHLRYAGWRGEQAIPIQAITAIEVGESQLSPRCSVPLLGLLWPGAPRQRDTLLITMQTHETAEAYLVVIADLIDARGWQQRIQQCRQELDQVQQMRQTYVAQRQAAESSLQKTRAWWQAADRECRRVRGEIAAFRRQINTIKTEQHLVNQARAHTARNAQQSKRQR